MTNVTTELFLQVGRKRYQVPTTEAAAEIYRDARDASGRGASSFPTARIVDGTGKALFHISYNGRVWPFAEWQEKWGNNDAR